MHKPPDAGPRWKLTVWLLCAITVLVCGAWAPVPPRWQTPVRIACIAAAYAMICVFFWAARSRGAAHTKRRTTTRRPAPQRPTASRTPSVVPLTPVQKHYLEAMRKRDEQQPPRLN